MYAKFEITGIIKVMTGMHIGGFNQFSAIGSVDSPVITDTLSGMPMIPGSSLKGKIRTLLAKKYNDHPVNEPNDDNDILLRLFGSSKKREIKKSRLLFSDMILNNIEELRNLGVRSVTEIKTENTIDRLSAKANPRQIERVIRGSTFGLNLIYEAEEESEIIEDFNIIREGLKLLEYDYLGGNGSRGYGKIKFSDLNVEVVMGDVAPNIIEDCKKLLKEV